MVRSVTISNLTNITTAALVVAVLNLFPCAGAMAQQMPGSGKVAEMKYSSYEMVYNGYQSTQKEAEAAAAGLDQKVTDKYDAYVAAQEAYKNMGCVKKNGEEKNSKKCRDARTAETQAKLEYEQASKKRDENEKKIEEAKENARKTQEIMDGIENGSIAPYEGDTSYPGYKAPEPETPSEPESENQDQKGNTSDAGCPEGQSEVRGECIADSSSSSNQTQSEQSVTGCAANYGLFSGLVTTGSRIFNGLRDLIYVVAGFGIIGVAVGGFFGNLNWKWLGAILIALVVVASTGEIINMITGCEDFSQGIITDTLK